MIGYWVRSASLVLEHNRKERLGLREELSVPFRVDLLDCDGLRVMTAARYFVYMDYARWAAVTRYGMVKPTLKNGWAPVVGAQQIIHRKPLLRGSRFDVKVRCVGWEADWFHYVHVFAQRGETRALGLTKTGVWKKGRMVPTTEVVTALEGRASEMPPPAWVQRALAGEDVAPE